MFSLPQGQKRSHKHSLTLSNSKVGAFYRRLSLCLESVRDELLCTGDMARRVCLTIIEEDLNALLEECEEDLVDTEFCSRRDMESLQSRSETVLEEASALLAVCRRGSSH